MESTASSSERGAGARSPNAARLARKRATDRKSQRNHRERHRAYVRSLEETVAGLKNASSADERVAMLSAENETLRARCQALATQLHRIRTITGENITRSDVAIQSPCPRVFCDMETLTGNIELPSGEISASLETLEPIAESSANVISANADDIVVPDTSVGTKDTNLEEYTGMARAIPALQEDPALSLVTFEPPPENFLPINPLSCFLSPPLPEYARPQGTADRLLHAMLEEAVAEHHAGRFDTSKPSLNRLLAHGPVDILSFRLFHYINQYGAMPMHWMLAIFWVQYLYLRVSSLKVYSSRIMLKRSLVARPQDRRGFCTCPRFHAPHDA